MQGWRSAAWQDVDLPNGHDSRTRIRHLFPNQETPKRHWRDKSDIEDIRLGLADLFRIITDYGIQSIAIPPLGCGNGGLKWDMVRGLMEEMLMDAQADRIAVYEPADQQDSPLTEKKTC